MESTRVKFNLRGTVFETTTTTIQKSEFLCALVSGKFSPPDDDGSYFIDKSAKLFDRVLNYLSNVNYPYPEKYKSELDFYCINYDEEELHKNPQDKIVELEEAKLEIEQGKLKIESTKHKMDKMEKKKCIRDGCLDNTYQEKYSDTVWWVCSKHRN